MARYSDDLYSETLEALIGDIYYAECVSFDAKISRMRKLAEVIVRRLIGHNSKSKLMLGDNRTTKALNDRGMTEPFFLESLRELNKVGSDSTHSGITVLPSEEDFESACKAMTNLYAYLFYDYFKKYDIDENDKVLTVFSTLPPYLRFTVLKEMVLGTEPKKNAIEKLAEAAVKALGAGGALCWVEENRERLSEVDLPYDSRDLLDTFQSLSQLDDIGLGDIGMAIYARQASLMCGSAYDYLEKVIPDLVVCESVPEGFKYETFEEAKAVYLGNGVVKDGTEGAAEFNALMRFVFEGRKQEEKKSLESHVSKLLKDLEELHTYCKEWESDGELTDEAISALRNAKSEIDETFSSLAGEVDSRSKNSPSHEI